MNNLAWVCVLGGFGAAARYLLAKWDGLLPWGILLGNSIAAVVATIALQGTLSVLLVTGLAGGLSTFSTLIAQTSGLWVKSKPRAAVNLALNLVIPCTVSVACGLLIS